MNTPKQGYSGYRPDIISILPTIPVTSVLDVGCGGGQLGVQIKQRYPSACVYGVEGDPKLAAIAANKLTDCWHVNLETGGWSTGMSDRRFDIIIFADVLEHLRSPADVLTEATKLLNPGGHIITCIPNIRHWSTFYYLGVRGFWPMNDRGIFDKTHLRFFARRDILKLHSSVDLEILREKRNVRIVEPWSWTNVPGKLLDWWPFRNFFTFQYIHLSIPAQKTDQAE